MAGWANGWQAMAFVYVLRCRDGCYYVGSTRVTLERRVAEHNNGTYGGFTKGRRPVVPVFAQEFERTVDAIAAERKLKGWSRAKKEALIHGELGKLPGLSRNRQNNGLILSLSKDEKLSPAADIANEQHK